MTAPPRTVAAAPGIGNDVAAGDRLGTDSRIDDAPTIGVLEGVTASLVPANRPKAIKSRRKRSRLSFVNNARLARVFALSVDVWQCEDEARDFLFRAHPMLRDQRSIDVVIRGEIGVRWCSICSAT